MERNHNHERITKDRPSWYTQIGRLKRHFTTLSIADLNYEERQKGRMIEALVDKLGVREELIVEVMENRADPAV